MSNIIDFAKAKGDADKERSTHILSLEVYMNADSHEVWATVEAVDQQGIDASWHSSVADTLRRLAWFSDGMAAELEPDVGAPIASLNLFEDSRISTRWNNALVVNEDQVAWIREQLMSGVEEI